MVAANGAEVLGKRGVAAAPQARHSEAKREPPLTDGWLL